MSGLELRRDSGKIHEGKPRSEPDWGKPTVRDRRGACGNVATIGSRTEAHRETDGNATVPYRRVRAALLSRPKGGDQGEHGPVAHVPGAEPGKRATGAGTCTASCKAAEEGTVHRASAPRHHRSASEGILCAQAQCGPWSGRCDVAVLRSRTGRTPPATACASTERSVPGTARSAAIHTKAGRQAAPAGDRCTGG